MSLRELVKHYLKIVGHALARSVHDRLDHTDHALDLIIDQNNRMARAQTALLESSIHTVHALNRAQADLNALKRRVAELTALKDTVEEQMVRQISVETDDYGFTNPETGLISFLYSFLPSPRALDIGAHAGDVSARMLETGYEVYAFEPYPPVYEKLAARLGPDQRFHCFNWALGAEEKQAELHLARDLSASGRYDDATAFSSLHPHSMPEDLPFTGTAAVTVKTLDGLHSDGTLPDDISLVKIDTEGYDLEVVRGMREHRYPVVLTEYWDTATPFGQSGLLYTFETMVKEMKARGYGWHLVLYRVWGRNQTAFYANHPRAVPNSWGNICFFGDFDLFLRAQAWCAAVLPRTYFKAVAG